MEAIQANNQSRMTDVLKLIHGEDVRRLRVCRGDLDYSHVVHLVREQFLTVDGALVGTLTYTDEDGDKCTLTKDTFDDWVNADNGILRLVVDKVNGVLAPLAGSKPVGPKKLFRLASLLQGNGMLTEHALQALVMFYSPDVLKRMEEKPCLTKKVIKKKKDFVVKLLRELHARTQDDELLEVVDHLETGGDDKNGVSTEAGDVQEPQVAVDQVLADGDDADGSDDDSSDDEDKQEENNTEEHLAGRPHEHKAATASNRGVATSAGNAYLASASASTRRPQEV